jgi:hypothetical protein
LVCPKAAEMLEFSGSTGAGNTAPSLTINRNGAAIMATAANATNPPSVKDCEHCGSPYRWPEGLHVNQWRRRRFCSHECSNASHHTPERRAERFWSKVDKSPGQGPFGECWEWQAGLQQNTGYGMFGENRTGRLAHRVAFEISIGPIPDGMFICHRCDNRKCVRPSHLFVGTNQDNMTDMKVKGRASSRPNETAPGAKLTADQVVAIRLDGRSHAQVAKAYGVCRNTVRNIRGGKTWVGGRDGRN